MPAGTEQVDLNRQRIKEAFGGVSYFIWKTESYGSLPKGTPEEAIEMCKMFGADQVCVKLTQGKNVSKLKRRPNVTTEWVTKVTQEKIKVSFWTYYDGSDPVISAKRYWDEYLKFAEIPGVMPVAVLDLEVEAEVRPKQAVAFIQELKRLSEGKITLLLCSWVYPEVHKPDAQKKFAALCNGLVPMAYGPGSNPVNYEKMFNKGRKQWENLDPRLKENPWMWVMGARGYVGNNGTPTEQNMETSTRWPKEHGMTGVIFWFMEWLRQYGKKYNIRTGFLVSLNDIWNRPAAAVIESADGEDGHLGILAGAVIRFSDYVRWAKNRINNK